MSLLTFFFKSIAWNLLSRIPYSVSVSGFRILCFSAARCQQLKPQRTESYENCVVEEIKEVELRSRRGKFIYKRNYSSVDLNKVSYFSRRCRAPSRLPVKKLKSLLQKTRKVRVFVWKGIRKNTPLSSKIHCYVNNRNCLDLKRYRSTSPNSFENEGRCICRLSIKQEVI